MKRMNLKATYCLALLALVAVAANAQSTTPTAKSPPPSAFDQWANEMKKPVEWMTWGMDIRVRDEYGNNLLTLSEDVALHEQNVIRMRERLWTTITPVTNLSVNARLTAEQREWTKPAFARQYGNRSGFEERYGIVDTANIKWNNALNLPMSVTAGRQDIMLGDPLNWWLVADGTPYDGSWTMFLDSVRIGYEAKELKTKFDLIYIYQNALPDDVIPTIGRSSENQYAGVDRPYYLTEQDEEGVVLYVSNKSVKNTQIDGYFIYKHDKSISEIAIGDDAEIYTFGAKLTGTPAEHWKYSVEGAYQFGHKEDPTVKSAPGDRDLSAYGFNGSLTYLLKDRLNNQVGLVAEYLSGDDADSKGTDEMFDVLWGRWPRFSELYIYSYAGETGGKIAQLNNIIRIGPTWSLNPMKGMTVSAAYNAMFAPEETPTRAVNAALFSKDGNFRGHYLQANLKHQFNKHWTTHLWAEFVWEGDYYAQQDLMTFLRAEVMFTF